MKQAIKSVLNLVGYDVQKTSRAGFDPFTDIRNLVTTPNTIFDVGANVGQSAIRFHRMFPDADIHSFEPGTAAFDRLKKIEGPRNRVWNIGMGEKCHSQSFFENKESVLSSFLKTGEEAWISPIVGTKETEISTVDYFCSKNSIQRIDVLKTDTQGYDLNVLKGAEQMMRSGKVNLVLTEINFEKFYAGQGSPAEIFDYLSSCGFRLFSIYQIFRRNDLAAWTDGLFVKTT